MGKSFRSITLCHTNDFHPSKNDKIKGWVNHNGGTFSKEITTSVTHLVASKAAWKDNHPLVEAARRQKTIKIVNLDWLENSLLSKSRRPKATLSYEWEPARVQMSCKKSTSNKKREKRQKIAAAGSVVYPNFLISAQQRSTGKQFDKECLEFERDMAISGYHPYQDQTAFVYIINLLRSDILRNRVEIYRLKVRYSPFFSSNFVACPVPLYYFPKPAPFSAHSVALAKLDTKHTKSNHQLRVPVMDPWAQCLQLYESDARPYTFACYVQYTRHGIQKQIQTVAPPGSSWSFAWEAFRRFFKLKCGIDWDDRPKVPENKTLENQDGANDHFIYHPPGDREPKGITSEALEGSTKIPTATMVMNKIEVADEELEAMAVTPPGGW